MTNLIKNNKTAILVSVVTFLLAGIAIFTAWRLYRMQSSAPQPSEAEERQLETVSSQDPIIESCEGLTFTITTNAQETDPTPTPTLTPTPTPTDVPVGGTDETATPTPTTTPTSAPSVTDAPTNTPGTQLPEAGVSLPTMIGISFGSLLLLVALALAI